MEKQLPSGRWIFIPNLSPETTDQDLADFIKQCGYEIPLERCSVRNCEGRMGNAYCTGMISIAEETIPHLLALLFTWMANGQVLNETPVMFQILDRHRAPKPTTRSWEARNQKGSENVRPHSSL